MSSRSPEGSPGPRTLDEVTASVVDSAYVIHRAVGSGLLESVYRQLLARELRRRQLSVHEEKPIPLQYEELVFETAFRADLVVANRVIVEIKSCDSLEAVHVRQLLTYLRLSRLQVGFLINFGAATLKHGLRRYVNGLPADLSPSLRINRPDDDP